MNSVDFVHSESDFAHSVQLRFLLHSASYFGDFFLELLLAVPHALDLFSAERRIFADSRL